MFNNRNSVQVIIVYCVAQSLPLPAVRVVQVALAWRRPFRVLKRKKVRRKYRNIADVQFETILKLELYLVYYVSLYSVSLQQRPERLQIHFCKWWCSTLVICYSNSSYLSIYTIFSFRHKLLCSKRNPLNEFKIVIFQQIRI